MRINFTCILLTLFYTGFNILPVVSVWIIVPSNDVKCGNDALFTKHSLAKAVEPGCYRMARYGHNWWLKPIKRLLLPKLYLGPYFTSSYPRFELKIKSQHSNGKFQYPKYKVIFEWNDKQKICTPRGIVTIFKSGSQHRCKEFYNPHREYDRVHDGSFGRHFKPLRGFELQKIKSDYSPESILDMGDMPPPRGFFGSAQSNKDDRPQELLSPGSSLEISHPSGSSSQRKSELSSSQMSPVNLPISSPLHRQKSALVPSLAPLKSESILSDKRPHDSSENQERPPPKAITPLNEKVVMSRIIIENSQDLGLAGLVKFP